LLFTAIPGHTVTISSVAVGTVVVVAMQELVFNGWTVRLLPELWKLPIPSG